MNIKNLSFPLLTKDQIEVRVGQVQEKGYTLLLYKDARTDAEILDKVVGKGDWQKKFYTLGGVGIGDKVRSIVVCSVGIYDDVRKEWIWKDDSGTESNVEEDKGVCSDSFKRASGGSCWGIGRELYNAGFIWVSGGTYKNQYGRYELTDKFQQLYVDEIKWNEDASECLVLVIKNKKTEEVVYSRGKAKPQPKPQPQQERKQEPVVTQPNRVQGITVDQKQILNAFINKLNAQDSKRVEKFMQNVVSNNYHVGSIDFLTKDQAQEIINLYVR